jgi:C4-dicarboxylate transporter DctM subunit
MIFSGVSGSGAADVSAIGSVLIPAMKKQGYSGEYSAAVTGASAMIGPIIPPSIPLVLFGLVAQVSVGQLFLGGVVPGLLMGVYLLLASFLISYRRKYPSSERSGLKRILRTGVDATAALVMPVIIIAGISSGIVTPTEAGGIAVAYGLIAGVFFYRELSFTDLPQVLAQSFLNSASLLIVVATTGIFSWIVASIGVAESMVEMLTTISQTPWVILLILNVFFLILGCFLEFPITMFVIIPMFIPVLESMGINMVHFGVVVIMNLMIGALTPPFGIAIFLTSALAKAKIESVIRELVPFLIALLVVLALCTFFPELVLWLPKVVMK